MKFDESMARIRLDELSDWVLADPLVDDEAHALGFVDLPEGCSAEYLPDGLCVAMRVYEEIRKLLSERPERRRLIYIHLETDTVCPTGVPRTREEIEARLNYSPPSIFVYDPVEGGWEQERPNIIYLEELDIHKVFEGCSFVGKGLVAKYAIFKDRVPWETGPEYGPVVIVGEAQWLPSDRDLRTLAERMGSWSPIESSGQMGG